MYPSKNRKTKCGYCQIDIKSENLSSHCQNVHKKPRLAVGETVMSKYFSSQSSDDSNPSKKAKFESTDEQNQEVNLADRDTDSVLSKTPVNLNESSRKPSALRSTEVEGTITLENVMGELKTIQEFLDVNKCEEKQKLVEISEKIEKMSLNLNKFQNKENKNESLEDNNELMERVKQLILFRSVQAILEHFSEFTYDEITKYFVCKTCIDKSDDEKSRKSNVTGGRFFYDHDIGMSFSSEEKLPTKFVHLKAHLKDHLLSSQHIHNWNEFNALQEHIRK